MSNVQVDSKRDAAPRPASPPIGGGPGGGLVGRSAPPFRLPGEHFAAAVTFWLFGTAGLIWVAPDIAQGLFPLPRVVAVTHLFTLGWITTSIMGALYQFLPVALLVPIHSVRLAHLSFILYVPGLALFVGGLLASSHSTLLTGALLFGTGLLFFAGNLVATLLRAPDRNLTWWSLAGAVFFLVSTVALGVSLAGNLRWGYLADNRFLAIGVHLHVAIAGWVLLVVAGVAHRLLPMFLLSHGASEVPGRMAVGMLVAGTGLLAVAHHALTPPLIGIIALLLAGGVLALLIQAALFFRHRKKPALDPGLRLAALALGFLGLALILVPFFLANGTDAPRIATAYVTSLLGGISLFVAGHYYKILPFLVWFHRFGPMIGKRPVPRVADLYATLPGNLAVLLLGIGTLGILVATLAGSTLIARPAAMLFAGGSAIVAIQMFNISRKGPK